MIHIHVGDNELRLEPLETEDHVGSVRFAFSFDTKGPNATAGYREQSVWISYAEIDRFTEEVGRFANLEGDFEEYLSLLDMSDDPVFTLRRSRNHSYLQVRRLLAATGDQEFAYQAQLGSDSLRRISDVFRDIARWW